jgi:hypothetical protein
MNCTALAAVPLKVTVELALKLVPLMVTTVPDPPEVGEKELTVGLALTTNGCEAVAVQPFPPMAV